MTSLERRGTRPRLLDPIQHRLANARAPFTLAESTDEPAGAAEPDAPIYYQIGALSFERLKQ